MPAQFTHQSNLPLLGTWADSDNGFKRDSWLPWKTGGRLAIPTNVTRFCRALLPRSADGAPQIIYYQAGLGSASNAYSYFVGGYLGEGISENIREAYAYICNNYEPGDDIFLIGFSRGAFTARSIGGLIASVGLLTKKGLADFYPIFKDWEHQNDPTYYKSKEYYPASFFPSRPNFADPSARAEYRKQLSALGLTRLDVPVEATAVWDTVGTLGVPNFVQPPLSWVQSHTRKEYAFVNTEIPSNLRYAYHALALDERRVPFAPTVWEMPEDPRRDTILQELKQCWFAGTHSNVGGSYPDTGQANLALAWLMQQLAPLGLAFDKDYLRSQAELNATYLANATPRVDRPWGCGRIWPTGGGAEGWLTGAANRTPGTYCRADPATGAPTTTRLRKTHEFVHPSVRVRRMLGGKGTDDSPVYNDPWPFAEKEGWKLVPPGGKFDADASLPDYRKGDLWEAEWEDRWKWVKQEAKGRLVWIAEEKMGDMEWDLVVKDGPASAKISARS